MWNRATTEGRRTGIPATALVAFWSIPILLSATQHVLIAPSGSGQSGFLEGVLRTAPGWALWAVFSLVVLRLAQRVPPRRATWRRVVAVHLPVAVAMALLHVVVLVFANRIASSSAEEWSWTENYRSFLSGMLHVDLLIYAALLALASAVEHVRQASEREAHAAGLRAQLAAARLDTLRMQLNPHFLFNSLNGAVTLVRTGENAAAARVLTGLGDLLRSTLDEGVAGLVPLSQELELLERYLSLERLRFGDRLRTEIVLEPGAADALVPSLILQPLVENAIRHGIEARREGGLVAIDARQSGGSLIVRVHNDGVAQPPANPARAGIGLANTVERLERLYPGEGRFELVTGGTRTTAIVRVPFRRAASPE